MRDFQRVIGLEAREQIQTTEQAGRLPDAVVACVGGGSNAIGIFHAFIDDAGVRLVGFEAAGDGVETGRHAATFTGGTPGAFQGAYSYLLQDEDGQTIESHSISAGLDYPGVGPEHAYLKDIGRAEYRPITDTEAMDALLLLCRTEGIIPAIESAHAVAGALKLGNELGEGAIILVNLSGRGDKDMDTAGRVVRPVRLTTDRTRREQASEPASPVSPNTFAAARSEGRAALVGYLPAGFPDLAGSIDACRALVEAGCDIVEVGIAYSDPVMDGPTIQAAAEQALRSGVRVRDVFSVVEAIADAGGKAVVMSYWNPVLRYGVDTFARDLAAAGGARDDHPEPDSRRGRRLVRRLVDPRPGSHLPGRTVLDRRASGQDPRGLARLRLRGLDHGCDRCARRGVLGRARAVLRASARTPTSRSASASACVRVRRPPRSPRTPTASSSVRRWSRLYPRASTRSAH